MKTKHLPQHSESLGHRHEAILIQGHHLLCHCVSWSCAVNLAVSFSFLCRDKLPLLCQLLPWATKRSQTPVFNVIGPFGRRMPMNEVRRSNSCQTVGPPLPVYITNRDCRAAHSLIIISSAWLCEHNEN